MPRQPFDTQIEFIFVPQLEPLMQDAREICVSTDAITIKPSTPHSRVRY